MMKKIDVVRYYDNIAVRFADQASDEQINRFEYQKNMPSLINMSEALTGAVLDFGCGAGNFTVLFQRDDRVVEGCDASPNLLKIAKKNYPNLNFISCNELGGVDSDKTYNLIIAKLVFHYIVDLGSVLANLHEKLSANGHILFSVPHPDKTRVHFPTAAEEAVYMDEIGSFGFALPMVHRSYDTLSALLTRCNFDIVDVETVHDNNQPKRLNILAKARPSPKPAK